MENQNDRFKRRFQRQIDFGLKMANFDAEVKKNKNVQVLSARMALE